MRLQIAWTIARKELLETLRDYRTLLMAIGLPMLFYPLFFISVSRLVEVQQKATEVRASQVAIWGDTPPELLALLKKEDITLLEPWLGLTAGLRQDLETGKLPPLQKEKATREEKRPDAKREKGEKKAVALEGVPPTPLEAEAQKLLAQRNLDAVLVLWPDPGAAVAYAPRPVAVLYDSVRGDSVKAEMRVERALETFEKGLLSARLRAQGLPDSYTNPLELRAQNVAPPARQAGQSMGGLLPLMLVLMSTLGTLYPAIDMTAGEKERGTMQTLLCSPIRPVEILLGKLMAVWVIAGITALVNLLSVAATAGRIFAEVLPQEISWTIYLACLAMMFPLIVVLSAIYFSICVFARDFKDAQNLITPFYILLSFLPAAATIPGVELTPWTAFIPVVNISLLVKGLLVGEGSTELIFLTVISSLAFGMLALLFAARVFSREQVVLGGREPLRVVLGLERSRGGVPSPTFALVSFALLLVVQFYGSLLLEKLGVLQQILGVQLGLILLPVILIVGGFGFDLRHTFSLKLPPAKAFLGSMLLGISGWAFAAGLLLRLLPPPESLSKALEEMLLLGDGRGNVGLALLVMALTPAICEELFFRGFILRGLSPLGRWPAIGLSALLFGILHASLYRLLPTAFLGVLMGYVVWQSRSLACSMVLHFLNNSIAVLVVYYGKSLALDGEILPWSWTLLGTGVMCVGLYLVRTSVQSEGSFQTPQKPMKSAAATTSERHSIQD